MSEGYDTSGLFDDIPMTNATRMELNHRVRMHVLASNTLIEEQAARIEEAEKDYHEERKARYAAQSELVISQARISEAVKVLEWVNAELKDHGYAEIGTLRETVINAIGTLGGK